MDESKFTKQSLDPYISIDNPISMIDTPIAILVHNLQPLQKITIVADIEYRHEQYISHAHFIANQNGMVNLTTDPSLGGTYQGVDGMGIFWSMRPSLGKERFMFYLHTVDVPYHVRLGILNGFQDVKRWGDVKSKILNENWLERWYAASDVVKIDVQLGKLHGFLFTPAGGSKRPGIIDVGGIKVSVVGHKGALWASYGYTCLSICVNDATKWPNFVPLDLDCFDEAVQFMLLHQLVDTKQGLAVIGISTGADVALHMPCYNPQIKVCISINSQSTYTWVACKAMYKGKCISADPPNCDEAIVSADGIRMHGIYSGKHIGNPIPVEKSQAYFLLIHSCDDQTYHYSHALHLVDRLRLARGNNGDKCEVHVYPGAGHILFPPYIPLCRSGYNPFMGCLVLYGGDERLHAVAQQNSWQCIIDCLSQNFKNNYTRIGRSKIVSKI